MRWRRLEGAPPAPLSVLTRAERRHADRLATQTLRERYRHAHLWLRHLLGDAMGCDPAAVELIRMPCSRCGEPHGKPVLADPAHEIEFNLSHAGSWAAIAITRACPVGIDLELLQKREHLESLGDAFLTAEERGALAALPAEDRSLAVLTQWVRKEALLKGSGSGLNVDPTTISLPVGDPVTGAPRPVAHAGAYWSVIDIPTPTVVTAVAVASQSVVLKMSATDLS